MTLEQRAELADKLNLGCGQDQRPGWWDVDAVPDVNPDEVVDLDEQWPWPDESFSYILMSHVLEHLDAEHALREASRVLESDGRLRVLYPLGQNFHADPDHDAQQRWTWCTPLFYTGERHWDVDVGLRVTTRDVTLVNHLSGVEHYVYGLWLRWRLRKFGPGAWCFGLPATSGEFEVVFRKP